MQRREREIQQQLMAQEESAMEMKETFTSLQDEVEHKTKKLNKVQATVWPVWCAVISTSWPTPLSFSPLSYPYSSVPS